MDAVVRGGDRGWTRTVMKIVLTQHDELTFGRGDLKRRARQFASLPAAIDANLAVAELALRFRPACGRMRSNRVPTGRRWAEDRAEG